VTFEELCGGLERGGSREVVEVVAGLLRLCRSERRTLAAALDPPRGRARFRILLAAAARRVAILPRRTETLTAGDAALLASFLREHAGDGVLAARGLAAALDDAFHDLFFLAFREEVRPLRPDDPVPVARLDRRALFGGGLSPDPDRLEVPPELDAPYDGTRHLRLVPRELGHHQLVLDTRDCERLRLADPLAPDAVLAAVVPSPQVDRDFAWQPHEEEGVRYFRDVAPRRPAPYRRRVLRLLEAADAAGAAVVLLPELSVDAELEAAAIAWFSRARHVRVLAAGSRHHAHRGAAAPRRNQGCLLVRGGGARTYCKFSNFVLADRTEYIERAPHEVTIVATETWSLTTLVCKDLLEAHARRAVADLRVTLVLVPACSPKTGELIDRARELASEGQATLLLANTPHGPDDDTAVLARPTARRPKAVAARDRADGGIVILFNVQSDAYGLALTYFHDD
jgi:hypothetical protein